MKNYQDRKYTIEEYTPEWQNRFATEAAVLKNIFGDLALGIEHIGSTAVPQLSGKPTIDILVTVNNIADIDTLVQHEYKSLGAYVTEDSRLFVKEKDNERFIHVHVFPKDNPRVANMLKVRDYLRAHPEKVAEYNNLKKELYAKYPDDYTSYRKYKDEWMLNLHATLNI